MPDLGIGSSDAPVIMGVSRFKTPWQLWAEKVGLLERKDEEEPHMAWGMRLEQTILDAFCGGRNAYLYQARHYHPERVWQRATLDALLLDEYGSPKTIVEVKCTVQHPPPVPRVEWLCQCLHQQLVVDEAREHILLVFGALDLQVWRLPHHQRALDRVLREEDAFLTMVERETPPPVSGRDASVLNRAWPIPVDVPVRLGSDMLAWDTLWTEARAQMAAWKDLKDRAEAEIKDAMGPSQKAVLPDGRVYTWTTQTSQEYVVAAKTTRVLRRKGE